KTGAFRLESSAAGTGGIWNAGANAERVRRWRSSSGRRYSLRIPAFTHRDRSPTMPSSPSGEDRERFGIRSSVGRWALVVACGLFSISLPAGLAPEDEELFTETLDVDVPPVSSDPDVTLDYDIVYVRARRSGDKVHRRFYTDFSQPV